jgi:RNA polymerase sigma-70 factor (ECF subfamily)
MPKLRRPPRATQGWSIGSSNVHGTERAVLDPKINDAAKRNTQFVKLLTSHQPQIYAYISAALCGDTAAADVLQETNLSLWAQVERYDFERPFLAWAFGFARQQVMAYRKTRSRSRLVFCEEVVDRIAEQCLLASDTVDDRLAALDRCMKRLSASQAELVRERYSSKVPVQTIARRLDVPAHAISSRLHRIRKSLAMCVQQTLATEVQ